LKSHAIFPVPLTNSYAHLPANFYTESLPVPVANPSLLAFNSELAGELGIDAEKLSTMELAQTFSGNQLPQGARPIAMAYSGHQFGRLSPLLGDGRALLLGEVADHQGGRLDIQLKGSGPTHFSRGGDGRAPVGPVLREYLLSEAMHALGVPTTRALAAVSSGEWVFRQTRKAGALLTRVAASHIRVGSFQYLALRQDFDALRLLADFVIKRHFQQEAKRWPLPGKEPTGEYYLSMFEEICKRQAKLIAQWMQLGFIHGVMNTDNMAISGETIDFGPCAFMDSFDPNKVFSAVDSSGRYAWQNQPAIGQWNLARLAEALYPLFETDGATEVASLNDVLDRYNQQYKMEWMSLMRAKLGLTAAHDEDEQLIEGLLATLKQGQGDYTLFFRRLCDLAASPYPKESQQQEQEGERLAPLDELFAKKSGWRHWLSRWQQRLAAEPMPAAMRAEAMRAVNPAYIPRNHRVDEAIRAVEYEQDFRLFNLLTEVLRNPYCDQPEYSEYQRPPQPGEQVVRTFCGT